MSLAQVLEEFSTATYDIYVTRYISIAGYAILIYDTFLTLSDEIAYIWPFSTLEDDDGSRSQFGGGKPSLIMLLINKYGVIFLLGLANLELSGLTGIDWGSNFCRGWIASHTMISFISIAISNVLVLMRVMALWGRREVITPLLLVLLFATTVGSLGLLGFLLEDLLPRISYSPLVQFCIVDPGTNTHQLSIPWAIPLLFDVAAMLVTVHHALHRPRDVKTTTIAVLKSDGVGYFIGLAAMRLINVFIVAIAPTPLLFSGGYFTWAVVTAVMGRFMITLRSSEVEAHIRRNPQDEEVCGESELGNKSSWKSGFNTFSITGTTTGDDPELGKVKAQFDLVSEMPLLY